MNDKLPLDPNYAPMQPTRVEFPDDKLGMTLVVQTVAANVGSKGSTGQETRIPSLSLSVDIFATSPEARRRLGAAASFPPDEIEKFATEGGDVNLLHVNPIEREAGMIPSFDKIKAVLENTGLDFSANILSRARGEYNTLANAPTANRARNLG